MSDSSLCKEQDKNKADHNNLKVIKLLIYRIHLRLRSLLFGSVAVALLDDYQFIFSLCL